MKIKHLFCQNIPPTTKFNICLPNVLFMLIPVQMQILIEPNPHLQKKKKKKKKKKPLHRPTRNVMGILCLRV